MAAPVSFPARLVAALALGGATLLAGWGVVAVLPEPARAQFFDDRYPFYDPGRRRQFFEPQQEEKPVDYSRAPAPAPRAPDAPAPTTTIMVMGDSTADWLAYGLEDALADQPEIAVIRKHKAFSGLIRYEARSEIEWPQVARDLLAAEKPNIVVMLVGVQDRQPIREKTPAKPVRGADPKKPGEGDAKKPAEGDAKKSGDAEQDSELTIAAPEPQPSKPSGPYEFRSEQWEEAYGKRVDDMIAALKSSGAAVVWVSLPAIRGTRSTGEASYLNEIYRARAEKAGIFYVDVWDGFVDEQGRFATFGPDVEGQNRRLRTADGVHFTKPGARKLAHYVERELHRGLLTRAIPVALPAPETPEPLQPAKPGVPAPRPLAGPVLFLNSPVRDQSELLGGGNARPAREDAVASRVLVKGEPATVAMGRADDFAWPLRAPNTKVDQPLPPSGPPVAVAAPSRPAEGTGAAPGASGPSRVAGQPVLSGQIRPQAQQRPPQPVPPFWRSAPQYTRPPPSGFFGLFR